MCVHAFADGFGGALTVVCLERGLVLRGWISFNGYPAAAAAERSRDRRDSSRRAVKGRYQQHQPLLARLHIKQWAWADAKRVLGVAGKRSRYPCWSSAVQDWNAAATCCAAAR